VRPRSLTNADLAELLPRRGDESEGIRQRAFRRAARSAFLWSEAAADFRAAGRPLTELRGIGPFLSVEITKRLSHPPSNVSPSELRRDFLLPIQPG